VGAAERARLAAHLAADSGLAFGIPLGIAILTRPTGICAWPWASAGSYSSTACSARDEALTIGGLPAHVGAAHHASSAAPRASPV